MNENSSRVEKLLQNILGSDFNLETPRSRMEQILKDIIDAVDPISVTPKSRIENLLISVASLITGGSMNLTTLDVDANGTYSPPDGFDGYDIVNVDVQPNLQPLSVDQNDIYYPEEGCDGFSEVKVDVPSEGYTNYMARTGVLTDILSNTGMSFATIVSHFRNLSNCLHVWPWAIIDASQIGLGTGGGPILTVTENDQTVLKLLSGQVDQSSSLATTITWDSTGLISAYVEQNGTITNLLSVASQINITIYLPWGD